MRISHAIGFSRVVESAPDGEKITPLCQPENLIAGEKLLKAYRMIIERFDTIQFQKYIDEI